MQTKSSYRVLKWTFFVGALASLGACVVTTGDGSGDFGDGGESGKSTTSTAGTTSNTGGTDSTTAGTTSTGGGGSTSTPTGGGGSGGTSAGGEGGDASTYVPGLCGDEATPSNLANTDLNSDDMTADFACRKCLKVSCRDPWRTCYGDTPTTACGFGSTKDAPGEFECIRSCFVDDMSGDDAETVLEGCQDKCLDQCADVDMGFATAATQDLLGCGQDHCLADCFTP